MITGCWKQVVALGVNRGCGVGIPSVFETKLTVQDGLESKEQDIVRIISDIARTYVNSIS